MRMFGAGQHFLSELRRKLEFDLDFDDDEDEEEDEV